MSLFNVAFADTTTAAAPAASAGFPGNIMSFLPMIVIFVLFWFLLIRPQQKKLKQHNAMLNQLSKGDKVVTSGGIIGRIVKLEEVTVDLEISHNVVIQIQRSAIGNKVVTEVVETTK